MTLKTIANFPQIINRCSRYDVLPNLPALF
jgi:hypothetical protein